MPSINLIHDQRQAFRRQERQSRVGFVVFAAAIGLGLAATVVVQFESARLRAEEVRLRTDLKKLEPIVRRIEQNDKDVALMRPRLKMLEDAQKVSGRWQRILGHLVTNTPRETWLTSFRASAADPQKAVQVTFVGLGKAQTSIGDLLLRTQNCPDLENVTLRFTEERMTPTSRSIQFEFGAEVAGTQPPKPKEKKSEEEKS